jgi:hypothetical protein
MHEMCSYEIEILVVIIEMHLDATFIAEHFSNTTWLLVCSDSSIKELKLSVLAISDNEYLPHVEAVNLIAVVTLHVLV